MGGTVRVLGWIRHAAADDQVTELRSSGQRRLLAALAANGGTVRIEMLSDMLDLAPSALRTSMSRLRARIGEHVIETDGSGYRLTVPVDATQFVDMVRSRGTLVERLDKLEEALALWDGDAFEEFSHEPWAETEAARLNELRLVAREDRSELLIASKRSGEAVALIEALVHDHPYRDRPRGLLIQALASDGRQSDALRAYQTYRSFLAEETGTEPSSAVQSIERRVGSGSSDETIEASASVVASGLVVDTPGGEAQGSAPAAANGGPTAEAELPEGILTFLFTDIEASTRRWETNPDRMRLAMAQHDSILRSEIGAHDGIVFKHTGDGVGAVFTSPSRCADAAIAVQRTLQTAEWPEDDRLKVRVGIYMGESAPTRGDYFGSPVTRAARIMDLANGDQIAIPASLSSFLGDMTVQRMGEHQLRGIGTESIALISEAGLAVDDRQLRSRVTGTRILPPHPHRLIGRDREVTELVEILDQHQAVTLVGPGGVGKTRLALAVGALAAPFFPDGVVFCELSEVDDGNSVEDAVAEALGARAQPGMDLTKSIVDFLSGRRVLLIFDNCEHVSIAVANLGREILALNSSAILATSRESIGLPAERLFGVTPLTPDTDAVELFIERAMERDRSFAPGDAELEHIKAICARLDGIPLGIELAAAWVRVLSPAELVEQLQDRFRVLRGGRAGGRHQTLRDTVLWSYEQLDARQARVFNRISVFSGGFSLEALESVCADDELIDGDDMLDIVMALVDKSMVVSVRGVGHIRFTVFGTLRQFGQEQLDASGESEAYRRRHAVHFGELAASEASKLISDQEAETWGHLARDWSNLRTAFETMLDLGESDDAAALVLELGWFAALSMRFELFSWVDELTESFSLDEHPDASSLYGLRALAAYFTVDLSGADLANRGLELDPVDRFGYCRLALTAVALNNELSAEVSATVTADWLDNLTDDAPLANRMWAQGMRIFHLCANDPSTTEVRERSTNLTALADASGSATAVGIAHWAGGMASTFEGLASALERWRLGVDSVRSLGDVHVVNDIIVGLELHFTVSRGDLVEAISGCLGAVERAHRNHYNAGTSHLFGVTAIVLCRAGQPETAAKLLGAMASNGHVPRGNARHAVQSALGDSATNLQELGTGLSINDAATIAMTALEEALVAHRVVEADAESQEINA